MENEELLLLGSKSFIFINVFYLKITFLKKCQHVFLSDNGFNNSSTTTTAAEINTRGHYI